MPSSSAMVGHPAPRSRSPSSVSARASMRASICSMSCSPLASRDASGAAAVLPRACSDAASSCRRCLRATRQLSRTALRDTAVANATSRASGISPTTRPAASSASVRRIVVEKMSSASCGASPRWPSCWRMRETRTVRCASVRAATCARSSGLGAPSVVLRSITGAVLAWQGVSTVTTDRWRLTVTAVPRILR